MSLFPKKWSISLTKKFPLILSSVR